MVRFSSWQQASILLLPVCFVSSFLYKADNMVLPSISDQASSDFPSCAFSFHSQSHRNFISHLLQAMGRQTPSLLPDLNPTGSLESTLFKVCIFVLFVVQSILTLVFNLIITFTFSIFILSAVSRRGHLTSRPLLCLFQGTFFRCLALPVGNTHLRCLNIFFVQIRKPLKQFLQKCEFVCYSQYFLSLIT